MSNGHLYFEIQADDIERAARFYKNVFGWRIEKRSEVPIEYRGIDTGGTAGGLLERPANRPPPECGTNSFVCSFEVDDFDTVASRIKDAGGSIALSKFAVPGVCWQGYFVDTEMNTFGLFEVDENAK